MRMHVKTIPISNFDYPLPEHRIARFPTEDRSGSKLLYFQDDKPADDRFYNIGKYLPEQSLLVGNETKVVNARLFFRKNGGALIELFCLEPSAEMGDLTTAFARSGEVNWKCLVGNSKRWKTGLISLELMHEGISFALSADRIQQFDDHSLVKFSWSNHSVSFAQILELAGETPLPPYIQRKAVESDKKRYQTIFAQYEGSVAAPTAGLHFTPELIHSLMMNGSKFEKVTLHVGAGTFKPVSTAIIGDHAMHSEKIVVSAATIRTILAHSGKPIIAIGTTSMRTLESLYWIGVMMQKSVNIELTEIALPQWFAYEHSEIRITMAEALESLLNYLQQSGLSSVTASTSLMIAPGYDFRVVNGLITNFHQPKSTLLLLVSALIGDRWKTAYQYALDHDFRFLSYGDSSLLFR